MSDVPIVGGVMRVVVFLTAGVLPRALTWLALSPVGFSIAVHAIESEIAGSRLMGRRFTTNPPSLIVALVFRSCGGKDRPARSLHFRRLRSP